MRRRERSIEDEYDEYAMDVPSRKRDFLYKVYIRCAWTAWALEFERLNRPEDKR